jgi:2-polyprenyl-3-methyl-5-hydroxy-6-metoxy-1,4-benzoquinol methylase
MANSGTPRTPGPDQAGKPDVDALVAELRAKVEERRRAGQYPPGLEEDLAAHFRRLLARRLEPPRPVDLRGPLTRVEEALPLRRDRIPLASQVPAGAALHKAVAKLVARQTQGVLEQVQAFAEPVRQALDALTTAVEDLTREVREDLVAQVAAVIDRQAAQERAAALAAAGGEAVPSPPPADGRNAFRPWYSSVRFEDEFRGSREDLLARYRDVAGRLAGCAPVFDLGCGRGEFVELLTGLGIEAWGVDLDAELVKAASDRGLPVEHGDGLRLLERMDEESLGGLVLIQVVEHLTPQEVVDLVDLATTKVRPGGQVLVETVNPQSLYAFAHAFYVDPTHLRPVHPAYLMFLFKEAGFASVDIEWRSPPPEGDVITGVDDPAADANNRRLNQLLFAPQDYLLVATR